MHNSDFVRRPGTVIFDVDSTLVAIEGIDWLAALRGVEVAERISAVTAEAMEGKIGLETIYETRLSQIAPTGEEITALGEAYIAALAKGAKDCVAALLARGTRTVLVSAGIQGALLPLGRHLGIPAADVHGVDVYHDAHGAYKDFDRTTPLTRSKGKAELVSRLGLPRPITVVGDGASDLEISTELREVDFIAFAGFARRERVVERAGLAVSSFKRLRHHLDLPP